MECSMIVAFDNHGGIGKNGVLPWHIKEDMLHFKKITESAPVGKMNAVIMGRKTWESLPSKQKPLANRYNIILSSQLNEGQNVVVCRTMDDAIKHVSMLQDIHHTFIIGGARVFEEGIKYCSKAYITHVQGNYHCDTFFPLDTFKKLFVSHDEESLNGTGYRFCTYVKFDKL